MNIQLLKQSLRQNKLIYFYFLCFSVIIIILDQLSKQVVENYLYYQQDIPVTSFFAITLVYNSGAAFSILSDAENWQRIFLVSVSAVSTLFLLWWLALELEKKLKSLSISFILGGAVGNLIDRTLHGEVIDFLLFRYANWYFPAFNLADAAISLGVMLMLINIYRNKNYT